jgi:hypothetical protein
MVYTGQTGHSIETKVKEHHGHIQLHHPEKLALAEHSIDLGHHILLNDTPIPWLKNLNAWTGSTGKQQRSKSNLTTPTERMGSP